MERRAVVRFMSMCLLGTGLATVGSTDVFGQRVQPCQTGAPLHLAQPVPPVSLLSTEFEDLAGILGSDTAHLVSGGRTGLGFRPAQGLPHLNFADAFTLGHDGGGFAFWLYNNRYFGSSQAGYHLLETNNPTNGFNIQLSVGLLPQLQGRLRLWTRDVSGTEREVEARVLNWSPGEWHHIAATWGGGFLRLYINARLVDEVAVPAGFLQGGVGAGVPNKLFLLSSGRNTVNPTPAGGAWTMDRLRTYARAITPDEVVELYLSEADRSGPVIQAGRLQLKLLGPKDGYGLESILDVATPRPVTVSAPPGRWWRMLFRAADGTDRGFWIDSTRSSPAATCTQDPSSGRVDLTWEFKLPTVDLDIDAAAAEGKLNFSLTPGRDEIEMRLEMKHQTDPTVNPWAVHLAGLRVGGLASIDPSAPENSQLILPGAAIGYTFDDPTARPVDGLSGDNLGWHNPFGTGILRYPSSPAAMQWTSLLDTSGTQGVYFAAHDPGGNIKSIFYDNSIGDPFSADLVGIGNMLGRHHGLGIDLETVVFSAGVDSVGNPHSQSWPVVLRLQDGGWWDHAQRYRQFALQQEWTQAGPLRERSHYPQWFAELGMIQPSTEYTTTVAVLEDAMQALGDQHGFDPAGHILWFFNSWHREGRAGSRHQVNDLPFTSIDSSFINLTDDAQRRGTPAAIYTLPTHWEIARDAGRLDTYSRGDWVNLDGSLHAVLARGQQPSEVVLPPGPDSDPNEPEIQMIRMDPASPLWRRLNRDLVARMSTTTLDGFYLDVLAAENPRLCYGADHGHASGGGAHRTRGYRDMLAEMRQVSNAIRDGLDQPRMAFFSEGFSEPYIDRLDGYLVWNLDQITSTPLPLALAVYHDYAQFIGRTTNIAALSKASPPQVLLDVRQLASARSGQMFVWGGMPGFIFGAISTGHTPVVQFRNYLLELARWRRVGLDYLVHGRMLPPVSLEIAQQAPNVPANVDVVVAAQPVATSPVSNLTTSGVENVPRLAASAWAGEKANGDPGIGFTVASLEIDAQAQCDPCWVFLPLPTLHLRTHLRSTQLQLNQLVLDGSRKNLARVDLSTPGILVRLTPLRTVLVEIVPVP